MLIARDLPRDDVAQSYAELIAGEFGDLAGRRPRMVVAADGFGTLDDAPALRRRILLTLARAAAAEDATERRRLNTFVVIGAGRTGVALAGAVAELVNEQGDADGCRADSDALPRVVLVDAGLRVLPGCAKGLSSLARSALQRLGVQLRLGVSVTDCEADGIVVAGKRIPSATVLWAEDRGASADRRGFVPICRGFAVGEFGPLHLSGSFAWLLWHAARLWSALSERDQTARSGWSRRAGARPAEPGDRNRALDTAMSARGLLLCR